jgi:hypothetical protein
MRETSDVAGGTAAEGFGCGRVLSLRGRVAENVPEVCA